MAKRRSRKVSKFLNFRKLKGFLLPAVIVGALAGIFIGLKFFPSSDIRVEASFIDSKVTGILKARGMYSGNMISRHESEWRKFGVHGKTVEYSIKLDNDFAARGLEGEIKKALSGVRGSSLKKFAARPASKGSARGVVDLFITYKGHVVYAASLKNIGMEKGPPVKKPKALKEPAGGEPAEKEDDTPSRPQGRQGGEAYLAIVLDDLGNTANNFDGLRRIGVPLTLAVLPGHQYSRQAAALAASIGADAILHLPLEPEKNVSGLEKSTITVNMDDARIKAIASGNMASLPGIKGVNNHMGSRATKDERVMRVVLSEVKSRGLFFLDSYTSPDSICAKVAGNIGLTYMKRDVFIDNIPDVPTIIDQIEYAARLARERGTVIAIGHDRPDTIRALEIAVPKLEKSGIRFIRLSDIVKKMD
jgi:polysaccharide deacetylase 2 family uncharacterized protein YibQ